MASAAELYRRRELLWNLTLRELRGRYKRSIVGWGWSLLNPIAFMLIYTFAFSIIITVDPVEGSPSGLESYPLFLMCAFLPWTFLTASTTQAMQAVLGNSALVRKVAFPREHLVNSVILAGLFTLAIEFLVLAIALLAFGNIVLLWVPLVILVSFLVAGFATGIGLALAAGNVYFRDLGYLWTIATQMWFFTTPIVYPPSMVESTFANHPVLLQVYNAMPATVIVRMYRNMLYDLRMPAASDFILLTGYSLVTLFAGWWIFSRLESRFAEEL